MLKAAKARGLARWVDLASSLAAYSGLKRARCRVATEEARLGAEVKGTTLARSLATVLGPFVELPTPSEAHRRPG